MVYPRCSCCRRPWTFIDGDVSERRSFPVDRKENTVCRACIEHAPFSMQKVTEHLDMWEGYFGATQQKHEAVAEGLRRQLADRDRQLAERPEQVVEKYLNQAEVDAAENEAQRAFRSRQNAWQVLCMIRLRHVELDNGQCRCGRAVAKCEDGLLVRDYPGLRQWERKQVQLLREHRPHALPAGHPALVDPRWRSAEESEWDAELDVDR